MKKIIIVILFVILLISTISCSTPENTQQPSNDNPSVGGGCGLLPLHSTIPFYNIQERGEL